MIQSGFMRLIFLWLLIIISQETFSQDTLLKHQTGLTTSTETLGGYETKIAATAKSGKLVVVISDREKLECAVYNKDFSLVAASKQALNKRNIELYKDYSIKWTGAIMNDKRACFFYGANPKFNRNKYLVWSEMVSYDGSLEHKLSIEIPAEVEILNWIFEDEKAYLICTDNKKQELVFYVFDVNGMAQEKRIQIKLKEYFKSKYSLSEYFYEATAIYPSQEQSLQSAVNLTKFFLQSNKIFAVVVNPGEPPHIWEFDLDRYIPKFKKLDMTGFSGFTGSTRFFNNATIFDGKIFVFNVTRKGSEIGIFDSTGSQLLKKFEIKKDSKFFFSELPRKTYRSSAKPQIDVIGDNARLFVLLTEGRVGIAVSKIHDTAYLVTSGTFDDNSTLVTYGSGPVSRVVQFKIIIQSSTLNQIEEPYTSPNDITEVTQRQELVVPYTQFRPFRWNGVDYLSYFTPGDGLFRIQTAVKE